LGSKLPWWIGGPLVLVTAGTLLLFELRRPLRRRRTESKLVRNVRNAVVAGVGSAVVQFVELPIVLPLCEQVERRGWGLLNVIPMPGWLRIITVVLLMDYTLYLWHILTHKVPLLWRFHAPHHADLDMDASTALRFHFGELVFSVPYRAAQVAAIGTTPLAFSIWQAFVIVSILFHHSNVRMPVSVERLLSWVLVTPRMHGIHHSIVREETDSNWSSGLSFWDRLHGTLRLNVPQDQITIGIPAYRSPAEVTVGKVLAMSFVEQRASWVLPDGVRPVRGPLASPSRELAD
jgi:sterol desaturase/sphingolipid hydroxylase (fatty acid hydroxylase superfamily)